MSGSARHGLRSASGGGRWTPAGWASTGRVRMSEGPGGPFCLAQEFGAKGMDEAELAELMPFLEEAICKYKNAPATWQTVCDDIEQRYGALAATKAREMFAAHYAACPQEPKPLKP